MGFVGAVVGGIIFIWVVRQLFEKPAQLEAQRAREESFAASDRAEAAEKATRLAQHQAEQTTTRSRCLALGHRWEEYTEGSLLTHRCGNCGLAEEELEEEMCRLARGHHWTTDDDGDEVCEQCDAYKSLQCLTGHVFVQDEYGDIGCRNDKCLMTPDWFEHLTVCAQAELAKKADAS